MDTSLVDVSWEKDRFEKCEIFLQQIVTRFLPTYFYSKWCISVGRVKHERLRNLRIRNRAYNYILQ